MAAKKKKVVKKKQIKKRQDLVCEGNVCMLK